MFSISELVNKLVGEVDFYGSTDEDEEALDNLQEAGLLIRDLIEDYLYNIAEETNGRPEASAKELHQTVLNIKKSIIKDLGDID